MVQVPGCGCGDGDVAAGGGTCASTIIREYCAAADGRPLLSRTVTTCNGASTTTILELDGTPYVGDVVRCDAATTIIEVADTPSIDMALSGDTISASLRINPASPAPLSITPAGLSVDCCPETITSVVDGDTVDFDLTGGALTAEVSIDPASTAPVSSGPAGLKIDCCSDAFQSVLDTNSIDLTLAAGVLSGDLRYADTNSVDLSVGASGLTADVRIDPASPMPISVTANGLSVADVSTGQWITQVKTSNEAFTNLVEQDIAELLGITPLANAVYEVQMLLITSSSSSAVGVQTRLNYPVGLGGSGHVIESPDNTYTSTHSRWGGPPISTGQNNVPAANETFLQRVVGIFDIGPTPGVGNIRPQVKSETGALVTVHRGSIFKWRRVL